MWFVVKLSSGEYVATQSQSAGTLFSEFPTKAEAQAQATKLNASAKKGVVGSLPVVGPVVSASETVGQFLGKLGEASLWLRVGEVVLGLILIAVGVAELTHAVPLATKVAGVAAKGAVMA